MADPIRKAPLPPPRVPPPRVSPPPRATGRRLSPSPTKSEVSVQVQPADPPAAAASNKAGDLIAGKYRLASLLGEGGMGAVWRARNLDLDVEVALKLIRSDAALADGTDRLLREAQSAAKLIDPGIVRVFDFGRSAQGDPFIVMELLEGEDLAAAIQRRGRLSAKRAVRVLLPVVRALSIAHQNGIVHRDLKPENVFLSTTPNGLQPKVVDFGIAQLEKSHGVRLTSTGVLMGSPLYMSPEQAKGESVDFRADIWGLTAVLYEALTGKSPFAAPNYNAVLCAIMLRDPERPGDEFGVDDDLWSITSRGLAKEPAFRFESMRHLGQALAGWLIECGEFTDITGASLETQWLTAAPAQDQLTTVFPANPVVRTENTERSERNALTQRISRDPAPMPASKPQASARPRKRGLVLAAVASGLVAVSALGWLAFGGTSEPETGPSAEAAPAPKLQAKPADPAQIRASVPAEPSKVSEPVVPSQADREAVEAEASEAALAAPEASATAAPVKAARPRPTSVKRAPSGKRSSKLKNPFAQ